MTIWRSLMPAGVVETLEKAGLSSAEDVANAFATGDRLWEWVSKKITHFPASEAKNLLAADRQLRREVGRDDLLEPGEKFHVTTFSPPPHPSPTPTKRAAGGKRGDDQHRQKSHKTRLFVPSLASRPPAPPPKRVMAEPLR